MLHAFAKFCSRLISRLSLARLCLIATVCVIGASLAQEQISTPDSLDFPSLRDDFLRPTDPDVVVREIERRGGHVAKLFEPILHSLDSTVTCTAAAKTFLAAWTDAGQPDSVVNLRAAYNQYKPLADAYRQACFQSASAISSQTMPSDAVGVFVRSDENGEYAFCVGFLISKNKLMTARHCFFDADSGRRLFTDAPKFYFFSDTAHSVALANPQNVWAQTEPFDAPNDFLIVTLSSDQRADPLSSADPLPLRTLRIPGPFLYAAGSWQSALSWTRPNLSCAVRTETNGGCFVHTCQTGPGFSGAPLLQLQGDSWRVIGIHVGGTAEQCRSNDGDTANLALPARGKF